MGLYLSTLLPQVVRLKIVKTAQIAPRGLFAWGWRALVYVTRRTVTGWSVTRRTFAFIAVSVRSIGVSVASVGIRVTVVCSTEVAPFASTPVVFDRIERFPFLACRRVSSETCKRAKNEEAVALPIFSCKSRGWVGDEKPKTKQQGVKFQKNTSFR